MRLHVLTFTDIKPFAKTYRYGFQGQEMDNELKGEGNSLNYTFRMHDPRVGRFFAVDPLAYKYPYYTPYSFSGNTVIAFTELEGAEELVAIVDKTNHLPEIRTVSGKDVIQNYVVAYSEKIGASYLVEKSYVEAMKKIEGGKLMASNGEIYTTKRLTEVEVLIDGNKVKITRGVNFGFKTNNKTVTTKGINQRTAQASKSFKLLGAIADNLGTILDIVSLTVDAVQNPESGLNALSLSPLGGFSQQMYDEDNVALINQLNIDFKNAKSKGVQSAKNFVNKYNQNYTKHFEVIMVSDDLAKDIMGGKIKGYDNLLDRKYSDKSINQNNAILIENAGDRAYIHAIYLNIQADTLPKK